MQRVSVSQLKPGMITARSIFNADGIKLLSSGMALTSSFIRRLYEMKIPAIFITNPYMEGIDVVPVVREEVRVKTIQTVKKSFCSLNSTHQEIPYLEIQSLGK